MEKIVEDLLKASDFWAIKLSEAIYNENAGRNNNEFFNLLIDNIENPIRYFHYLTHDRWHNAYILNNVDCLYALPKELQKEIEELNTEDFIKTWNSVLSWIDNNLRGEKKDTYSLLVKALLTKGYGYFNNVNPKELYGIKGE